jgi:hypothetical protein
MTRPNGWFRSTPWLISSLLLPQALGAQQVVSMHYDVTLSAFALRYTGPKVFSDATAALFDRNTGARVTSTVILGHQVKDLTSNFVLYEGRYVSDTGQASTSTGEMAGSHDACYEAKMAGHANAFNIHAGFTTAIQCMEIIDIEMPPPPPDENCPILLDLALNGFHLSGPDPAVSFDIDADGALDSIAWTKAGGDDAFLCLDRNHNDVIDDGRELFGYATLLLSGERAQIGYRALAELDRPELGGNQDGRIDTRDAKFHELCAWIDTNRDGMSQAREIRTLDQVGVGGLEYDYRTTDLQDFYGNLFRYASRAEMRTASGHLRRWPTYDVIFAEP